MSNPQAEMTTVSGVKVRIYSTDTGPHGKIHGAYFDGESNWHQASWQATGYFHPYNDIQGQHKCSLDLDLVAGQTKA